MKFIGVAPFLAVCGALIAGATRVSLSPITRVVELLQKLSANIEADQKNEEDLYDKFVCWGQTVIQDKTASNAAAESRIEMLETYITDLEAGRIEITSERADLEKELETLLADMEAASELREQEKSEFLEAEEEMKKGITALQKAIEVLDEATAGHEKMTLLSFEHEMHDGFAQRMSDRASLDKAVELGQKFLTKGDARFLRRLLTGDVPPVADWKKLNRKATFKMSYKARSGKIQDVLSKLLATFSTNLAEAQNKETEAEKTFNALMATKSEQKDKAKAALDAMEEENGARGMSKEDAQSEVDELKTQVENDQKFITQTQQTLATKKQEWKERQELRTGELGAISKAISILHSDDSRDLFKKSFASQGGASFLQKDSSSGGSQQQKAAEIIRQVAQKAHDSRLLRLASFMTSASTPVLSLAGTVMFAPAPAPAPSDKFKPVIESIDQMIAILNSEMDEDLKNKEACEADRMTDTRNAILASRAIDETSDSITTLESEVKSLKAEIEEKQAELAQIIADIAKAGQIRDAEKAAWQQSDEDDRQAAEVVEMALGVLETFYKENGLMLAQQAPAGQAPPPPPTTWDAPYGGKTKESAGILDILGIIKQDIEKDRAKADAEEKAAAHAYIVAFDEFKLQNTALKEAIGTLEGTVGSKEQEVVTSKEGRATKKGELDVHMKKLKDAEPGCNFITVNFQVRLTNRQAEVDGLQKAKALLQGASFD